MYKMLLLLCFIFKLENLLFIDFMFLIKGEVDRYWYIMYMYFFKVVCLLFVYNFVCLIIF